MDELNDKSNEKLHQKLNEKSNEKLNEEWIISVTALQVFTPWGSRIRSGDKMIPILVFQPIPEQDEGAALP